jgi:hypothetical protein
VVIFFLLLRLLTLFISLIGQNNDNIVATQVGDLVVVDDRDSQLAKESLCRLFVGPYGYRVFTAGVKCLSDVMNILLSHLLTAACVITPCSAQESCPLACGMFRRGFGSQIDMVCYILDILLNADVRELSTSAMVLCVQVLGLDEC